MLTHCVTVSTLDTVIMFREEDHLKIIWVGGTQPGPSCISTAVTLPIVYLKPFFQTLLFTVHYCLLGLCWPVTRLQSPSSCNVIGQIKEEAKKAENWPYFSVSAIRF